MALHDTYILTDQLPPSLWLFRPMQHLFDFCFCTLDGQDQILLDTDELSPAVYTSNQTPLCLLFLFLFSNIYLANHQVIQLLIFLICSPQLIFASFASIFSQ